MITFKCDKSHYRYSAMPGFFWCANCLLSGPDFSFKHGKNATGEPVVAELEQYPQWK